MADVEVEDAPEEIPAEDPTDEKGEGEPEKQLSKNAKIAIAAVAVVLMVALGVFLFNQQQQKDFENDVEAQVLEEAKAEYEARRSSLPKTITLSLRSTKSIRLSYPSLTRAMAR